MPICTPDSIYVPVNDVVGHTLSRLKDMIMGPCEQLFELNETDELHVILHGIYFIIIYTAMLV